MFGEDQVGHRVVDFSFESIIVSVFATEGSYPPISPRGEEILFVEHNGLKYVEFFFPVEKIGRRELEVVSSLLSR